MSGEAEALARAFRAVTGHDLPTERAPWDEGLEARMDQIVQSYDEETGRHRPLRPRRDR